MKIYVAELDEQLRVSAVWVKKRTARSPSIFDPSKHVFDAKADAEFWGAPRNEIVRWLNDSRARSS